MKRLWIAAILLVYVLAVAAQESKYSTFYYQRATLFEVLPITSDDIVFVGNSITNGAEWGELFQNPHVKNRGISGDVCQGVYDRLDAVLKGKPAKLFLLIGINDINRGVPADTIVRRIGKIIDKVKRDSPCTKFYLQSVLPVTEHYGMFQGHTSRWQEVPRVNAGLRRLAEHEHVTYVDLYSYFVDPQTDRMDIRYTNDGLHLLGTGYLKWVEIVKPYVEEK